MYRKRSTLTLTLAALCMLLAVALLRSVSPADSLALENYRFSGARVYVIRADLNDPRLRIDIGLPARGLAHSESFEAMIRRRAPLAAVTGTYFCTRSLIPVGTIIVGGRKIHVSCIGNTVHFLGSNQVIFIDTVKGQDCDDAGAQCGLRTGPRLLNNSQYALNPRREGFRHPGLFGTHSRMALGVTRHNKLLLVSVVTPVTFARTAAIMKALGAVDAVCLDGGSSSAMYYRGRLIRRPGRALTNIIEVRSAPFATGVRLSEAGYTLFITRANAALCIVLRQPSGVPNEAQSAVYEQAAVLDPATPRRPLSRALLGYTYRPQA